MLVRWQSGLSLRKPNIRSTFHPFRSSKLSVDVFTSEHTDTDLVAEPALPIQVESGNNVPLFFGVSRFAALNRREQRGRKCWKFKERNEIKSESCRAKNQRGVHNESCFAFNLNWPLNAAATPSLKQFFNSSRNWNFVLKRRSFSRMASLECLAHLMASDLEVLQAGTSKIDCL